MSLNGPRHFFSPDPLHPAFSYGINAPQSFAAARAQAAAMPLLEEARKRLLCVALGFLACFLLISGRLFDVMILNADIERSGSSTTLPAHVSRADIVDRNGELLATSLQLASLAADPAYVLDEKETLTKLKTVFPDLDAAATSKELHSGKRFVWLRHSLTPKQQEQVNNLGLTGLSFQNEERRIYPKGALTAHIIGYNSVDQQGLAGIEHSLNKRLTGSDENLQLSIDIRLQNMMHDALLDGMHKFDATGGAGLIMDVETGEILSLVSLPDFDPNAPQQASDSARFNRATLGAYEMGSTFKIFTIAQALEQGAITLADSFDCRKPLKFGRFEIHDFHPENRFLTVPEIFVYSSNIGAAQIIQRVNGEDQKKFLGTLGLLDPSPVEVSEVTKPLVPDVWRDINKTTIAYGHGLSVSAVQLASAAASVINGGHLVKPTLLRRAHAPANGPTVVSTNTSNQMRALMRAVVLDGTGKSAAVNGYLVGGKTGTADKSVGGGYNRKARLASFIAAYPIHRPRYLVFAMIDEPKGNKESHGYATGGWVSAPVVAKVIEQSAPLLRVPPVDENDPLILERLRLPGIIGGAKKETKKVTKATPAPPVAPSNADVDTTGMGLR